jgi:hypothetical protein
MAAKGQRAHARRATQPARGAAVRALLLMRRMAHPRIRDFVSYLTTLPAAMMIFICLFLPHQVDCSKPVEKTPLDTVHRVAIAPTVHLGLFPVASPALPLIRAAPPHLAPPLARIPLPLASARVAGAF